MHTVFIQKKGPVKIRVAPFLIQINEVTNDQFAHFAKETGHVTEAESNGGSASFVQSDTPEQWLWVALW
ncbi:SUMF1/EgtB/PvdO family nonheme iron enzyme [SAR92 clade bacterium H246]